MPLLRRTAADLDRERAEQDARVAHRRAERLKSHALAGAIVFAFAQFALGMLTVGPSLLGILLMAPFGAALGCLATLRGWGMAQSTAAGFLMVALFLAGLLLMGGAGALALPWVVVGAATSGGIPGCLVGFHVQHAT